MTRFFDLTLDDQAKLADKINSDCRGWLDSLPQPVFNNLEIREHFRRFLLEYNKSLEEYRIKLNFDYESSLTDSLSITIELLR